jgi:hypothetical protein
MFLVRGGQKNQTRTDDPIHMIVSNPSSDNDMIIKTMNNVK